MHAWANHPAAWLPTGSSKAHRSIHAKQESRHMCLALCQWQRANPEATVRIPQGTEAQGVCNQMPPAVALDRSYRGQIRPCFDGSTGEVCLLTD